MGTSCGKLGRLDSCGERAALVVGFLKSLAQFTVGDKVGWPQCHGLLQCLDGSIMLPTTSLYAAQSQPNIGLTGPSLRCLSGSFGSFLKSPLSLQYDYQRGMGCRGRIALVDRLARGLSSAIKRTIVPKYEFGKSNIMRWCRRTSRQVGIAIFDSGTYITRSPL